MTAITWTDVVSLPGALADGMANVPALGQTALLVMANDYFDLALFTGGEGNTTVLPLCRALLVAHIAALSRLGQGGPLTGEEDGRLSRQYAIPMGRSELCKTGYGTALYALLPSRTFGPRVL